MREHKEQEETVEAEVKAQEREEEAQMPEAEEKHEAADEVAVQSAEASEEQEKETKSGEAAESEALHEDEEEGEIDAHLGNLKKHDAAVLLIKKAKHIVHDAKAQTDACRLLLSDDLEAFEHAKTSLKKGGMDESEALLEALGFAGENTEEPEERVVFEAKEEVPPVYIRDVSSGRFSAFMLALVFGAATLLGLVYLATEKLGITLDLSKVPSAETTHSILGWFGSLVGVNEPFLGGALLAAAVLLVMWVVYAIRVALKASANLSFAKEELKKAEEYAVLKGSCKDEMDKVDAHIKDAIEMMKTYEVIFNEQKGKLKRIQHIEQQGKESETYHAKSLKEMEDTYELIQTIKDFLNTPMSEEGKLSGKSTLFLYRAKNRLEKTIDRLY